MTNIITISKTGTIKTETVKKTEAKNLYKKCKLRKSTDFKIRHTWKYKDHWISIYAKDNGRAGSENKYDLPPPVDSVLYFGSMVVIKHANEIVVDEEIQDFTKEDWLKVYEKLMGGFEDLEEEVTSEEKTKEGYLKDGFVVPDDEDDYISQSEEETDKSPEEQCDEADYGGETDSEEEKEEENEEEEEEEEIGDPASELSEEEYNY
jgi:hypothetical protein